MCFMSNLENLEIRTAAFVEELNNQFHGLLRLSPHTLYEGPQHSIDVICAICGLKTSGAAQAMLEDTKSCKGCRTTKTQLKELHAHIQALRLTTFKILFLPARFSGKSRLYYECTLCKSQHLLTPGAAMDPKTKCPGCTIVTITARSNSSYSERLDSLYEGRIVCLDRFHQTRSLNHRCDAKPAHTWKAPISKMLLGSGCPMCRTPVTVKHIAQTEYRNRKYQLGSLLERKALAVVCAEARTAVNLRTRLDYPLPALSKNHVPAFLIKDQHLLLDVFAASKHSRYEKLIRRSRKKAAKLGFSYGIVLVTKGPDARALLLKTKDWTDGSKSAPEDWNAETFDVGNGNRRMKIFTPKGA